VAAEEYRPPQIEAIDLVRLAATTQQAVFVAVGEDSKHQASQLRNQQLRPTYFVLDWREKERNKLKETGRGEESNEPLTKGRVDRGGRK
jgi:hypothetical protein